MPILAIDTSTMVSGAAIASSQRLIAEITMQLKIPQSQVLLGHIKDVLNIARVDKHDLEAIAISIGPGSFTGLRIGLATAKMMAYALDIPIITVPSLKALAYHYPVSNIYIASTLDAQKGNAYVALYTWDNKANDFITVEDVKVRDFKEIIADYNKLDKPVIFVGDIAQKKADIIAEFGSENISLGLPHLCMPRAANVAMAAMPYLAKGEFANIMNLEPIYIRRSEAEVLWEKRHQQAQEDNAK